VAGEDLFERLGFCVAAAGKKAAEAQKAWAAISDEQRAAVLRKAGDLWARHADEVTTWIIRETGSIPPKANFEIHMATTECYEASAPQVPFAASRNQAPYPF
jgi:benzaldehyde dehydrogenase (NAD)